MNILFKWNINNSGTHQCSCINQFVFNIKNKFYCRGPPLHIYYTLIFTKYISKNFFKTFKIILSNK